MPAPLLAGRVSRAGRPLPLIAETGGQNAVIVDSSALAGQVVGDVSASAFDSAGQRCSALHELRIGRTDQLSVDVGPVITAEAPGAIEAHVAAMRGKGLKVEHIALAALAENGTFVPPTIIEIDALATLEREVFGPVLHVPRYRRAEMDRLIDAINETGYGLTFGLHTRLDEAIARVTDRVEAGNLYVNRNIIGAVVGSEPFGGRGLSGTGPKAGGPLYLGRLVSEPTVPRLRGSSQPNPVLFDHASWLEARGDTALAESAREAGESSALGLSVDLTGPASERPDPSRGR